MNNINIGYRINIDSFISTKEEIISFLNYYNRLFNCSELKVTPTLLNSNDLDFIILNYLNNQFYSRNFHVDKNFLYNYNSNMKEKKLFSLLNGSKSNLITHLNESKVNFDLYQSLMNISLIIPEGNMLLLENPDLSGDLFEYLFNCEELSKKMNLDNINNVGFCLDFGHILQFLSNNGISFDSYYDFLLNQKNYLKRIKEFHLHDFKCGNDHQIFDNININLSNFKKIYLQKHTNTIILENNVSYDVENVGVKQIKMIKRMLLDED